MKPKEEKMVIGEIIPVSLLFESENNPRRRFNVQKMDDLIGSVKESGILVPLIVRRVEKNGGPAYEILAGSRRYRAAAALELPDVPCVVKEVDDDTALEIQLFENDQREDVHPLEQAIGYRQWIDRPGHTVSELALKLGCSETKIYKRLKLLDLVFEIQEAYLDEKITTEHAMQIARLQPKDQEKAFAECFEKYGDKSLLSVNHLKGWIEYNIHLDLSRAPFDITDADLLPAAGSCVECPKRTGFNKHLFSDIQKDDMCTDGACYKRKLQAHINRAIAQNEEKGKPLLRVTSAYSSKAKDGAPLAASQYAVVHGKENSCASAQKAIVVSGPNDKGKVITVCADASCKIHAKSKSTAGGFDSDEWNRKQKDLEKKAQKEELIRTSVYEAMVEKAKNQAWDISDWRLIARTLSRNCGQGRLIVAKGRGWVEGKANYVKDDVLFKNLLKLETEDLCNYIIELCLSQDVTVGPYDTRKRPAEFIEQARRYGVDIKAIEKSVLGKSKEEKPPAAPEAKNRKKNRKKAKK